MSVFPHLDIFKKKNKKNTLLWKSQYCYYALEIYGLNAAYIILFRISLIQSPTYAMFLLVVRSSFCNTLHKRLNHTTLLSSNTVILSFTLCSLIHIDMCRGLRY